MSFSETRDVWLFFLLTILCNCYNDNKLYSEVACLIGIPETKKYISATVPIFALCSLNCKASLAILAKGLERGPEGNYKIRAVV